VIGSARAVSRGAMRGEAVDVIDPHPRFTTAGRKIEFPDCAQHDHGADTPDVD